MTATSRSSLRQADVRTAAESFGLFTSTSPQKLKLPNSPGDGTSNIFQFKSAAANPP